MDIYTHNDEIQHPCIFLRLTQELQYLERNSYVILIFHLIIASFIVPTHEPGLARGMFLKFVFTIVVVLVADYQHV